MSRLGAILGVAVLWVVVVGCGDVSPVASEGETKIVGTPKAAEGPEIAISGFLIVDRDGNARLCNGLLESSPPQCGGDHIELLGFDATSVPDTRTPETPGEINTARWTDRPITVIGIKGVDGLAEVRLSTETPTTPELQPGAAGTGMIVPNLWLTFDGVEYNAVEILGVPTSDGPIVCCGTPISFDDVVGVGGATQHNPDGDSLVDVFRLKDGTTTDLYTFHPAETAQGSGDPGGIEAVPATWTRWTAE